MRANALDTDQSFLLHFLSFNIRGILSDTPFSSLLSNSCQKGCLVPFMLALDELGDEIDRRVCQFNIKEMASV